MTAVGYTESVVEDAAIQWFAGIGYSIGHGPDLEPGGIIQAFRDYGMWRNVSFTVAHNLTVVNANDRYVPLKLALCVTICSIPPVASTAGEGGKPPGGGHLRVVPFAFQRLGASA